MIDQALAAFADDLVAAAAERGITVTPDLMERVFNESLANGFNPDATRSALDAIDVEPEEDPIRAESVVDQAARDVYGLQANGLQQKLGRELTAREHEHLYSEFSQGSTVANAYAAREARLDTREGRHAFIAERMGEHANRERETRLDREPDREFDLDNPRDRGDYLRARADGAEFEEASDA